MDMLARHSSSPGGFFSNLTVDNGEPTSQPLIANASASYRLLSKIASIISKCLSLI
jgi:hypothetical protein